MGESVRDVRLIESITGMCGSVSERFCVFMFACVRVRVCVCVARIEDTKRIPDRSLALLFGFVSVVPLKVWTVSVPHYQLSSTHGLTLHIYHYLCSLCMGSLGGVKLWLEAWS